MNKTGEILNSWRNFKNGKEKLRVTRIDPKTKKRTVSLKGIEEIKEERKEELKKIRKEFLKLSQKDMATAIHVSTRTLQGWEIGRSLIPEPVILLVRLMKDIPEVKKRLLKS